MTKLQHSKLITNIDEASLQTIYFSQENIVINANVDYSTNFTTTDVKKLIIVDSNSNIIATIPTTPVNWYSTNKNNFSGFQSVITPAVTNKLIKNTAYNIMIQFIINGEEVKLPIKNIVGTSLIHNNSFTIDENIDKSIYLEKISDTVKPVIVDKGKAVLIDGYWTEFAYITNIEVDINENIAQTDEIQIISKDKNISIKGINVSWYSSNKSTYNGAQFTIDPTSIEKILSSEQLFVTVTIGSTTYSMPLTYSVNSNQTTLGEMSYRFTTKDNTIFVVKQ